MHVAIGMAMERSATTRWCEPAGRRGELRVRTSCARGSNVRTARHAAVGSHSAGKKTGSAARRLGRVLFGRAVTWFMASWTRLSGWRSVTSAVTIS